MRFPHSALHALGELVWPRDCLLCEAALPPEPSPVSLCPRCTAELASDAFATCPRCASSIGPHVPDTGDCPRCRNETYHFASAQRLGVYDGKLRDAVLAIKQPRREALAETLGMFWGHHSGPRLLQSNPQVIVPVPLHWRRRWSRGSNQVESLARGLSLVLKLPMSTWAVWRVRATPMQTTQSLAERRRNVVGAFRTRSVSAVKDLRVLLIDDVLTTGATCEAVTQALLDAGAAQVHVAVLAHR